MRASATPGFPSSALHNFVLLKWMPTPAFPRHSCRQPPINVSYPLRWAHNVYIVEKSEHQSFPTTQTSLHLDQCSVLPNSQKKWHQGIALFSSFALLNLPRVPPEEWKCRTTGINFSPSTMFDTPRIRTSGYRVVPTQSTDKNCRSFVQSSLCSDHVHRALRTFSGGGRFAPRGCRG